VFEWLYGLIRRDNALQPFGEGYKFVSFRLFGVVVGEYLLGPGEDLANRADSCQVQSSTDFPRVSAAAATHRLHCRGRSGSDIEKDFLLKDTFNL
jgi:hypothetical protein